MKAAKIGLALLGVLVAIFFTLGIMVPEFEYESEVHVDASVEKAFAVFTDPFKTKEWLTGFKSIKLRKGFPYEVGSEYELTMEMEGGTFVMRETITDFKNNELFAFHLANHQLGVSKVVKFSADGDKTVISSSTNVQGKNIFWRSVLTLMQSSLNKSDQEVSNQLKELIEREAQS